MKHIILFLLFAYSASASLINFQSGTLSTYLQSNLVDTLSDEPEGTYQFALGTFDETVLSGSISNWFAAFTNQMDGVNVWKTTGPAPLQNRFQNEHIMSDGTATGQAAYILGSKTDMSEIVIFKNPAWVFPAFNPLDVAADIYSLQDAGTEVVSSGGSFSAFDNNLTMIAVPEPSSFALLAGVFGLAWVMVRRRA